MFWDLVDQADVKSQRPASPSKFSSEASDSPSKLNVPRKQRNQPSNRVGDIEFAVDINNSLIGQVRQLQAVISERDEALKVATFEKSQLELEAEGFSQRLKTLDESEQRYKDENWSLETQTHELIAAAKDAAGREQKLQQVLALTTSEKSEAQRDLDDLKQTHGRIVEDLMFARKNHDTELATLRKNMNLGETEKGALRRKLEDVTAQNQELAKAVAAHFRNEQNEPEKEASSEFEDDSMERFDPEHSPPPSPTKGIPRNAMLESETLKSSLNHAHRMIQNLKANVHREKTEKLDLKRMLQETRDELEIRRREVGGANHDNKRAKTKSQQDTMKKGPRPNMLGQGRSSRTDVLLDEAGWEDHSANVDHDQANRPSLNYATRGAGLGQRVDASDAYQTANETDNSFETANERDSTTENEAFQTGAESIAGESSDELTETEGGMTRGGTLRASRPSPLSLKKPGDRSSYGSTATTDDEESSLKTPVQTQPQRYRLKINRGARKSRPLSELLVGSDPSSAKNSPASFVGSSGQAGQSLFAELGELEGGDSDEVADGTPIRGSSSHRSTRSMTRSISRPRSSRSLRRSSSSRHSTPGAGTSRVVQSLEEPPLPRLPLVDSGMMTDPWEPLQQTLGQSGSDIITENKDWEGSSTLPSTPQNKNIGAVQPNRSNVDSTPVVASAPPRTIWDQPLEMFASIIPTFGNSSRTTPVSAQPDSSREISASRSPEETNLNNLRSQGLLQSNASTPEGSKTLRREQTPTVSRSEIVTPLPILTLSPIRSLETVPTSGSQHHFAQGQQGIAKSTNPRGIGSEALGAQLEGSDTVRIIDTIFGSNRSRVAATPRIAEDETSQDFASLPVLNNEEGKRPFREIPSNAVQQHSPKKSNQTDEYQSVSTDMADHSSQTMLSSEQIDNMLQQKDRYLTGGNQKISPSSIMKPLSEIGAVSPPLPNQRFPESTDTSKGKVVEHTSREANTFAKVPKRPLSTTSIRSRTGQYPPLPPDHQQAIAAAAQRAPVEPSAAVMGPPLAPASAYRSNMTRPRTPSRPRTPNEQRVQSGVPKGATTPRARNSTRSQVSRRSSVSSFASEIDERFNIRLDGMPIPNGLESSTDPRIIQAITQTMIGEFLWKYTRKAGREDMSSNRHRRFFWVHPYTRTLYWSDKDPSTAGRAELKAKSVAIEAVQVVMDDNPMPPGLHRKSLIIITPGRSVKLTATTSQRHETWFNALSYLLLRAGPEGANAEAGNTTTEDLEEFNPSYGRRASRTVASRISLASFRSNASQRSLTTRAPSGLSTHSKAPASVQRGQSTSVNSRYSQRHASRNQGSISSRLSGYWRPGTLSVRDSVSGLNRRSAEQQQAQEGQEVNGAAHDSAEDLRQVIEQQERRADQLENVRACCDGEFNLFATIAKLCKSDDQLTRKSQVDMTLVHCQEAADITPTSRTPTHSPTSM